MSDDKRHSTDETGDSTMRDPWACYEDQDANCGAEFETADDDCCCCCCCS